MGWWILTEAYLAQEVVRERLVNLELRNRIGIVPYVDVVHESVLPGNLRLGRSAR